MKLGASDDLVSKIAALSDCYAHLMRPGTARQKYHGWRREHGMAEIGEDVVTQRARKAGEKLREDLLGELSPEEFLLLAIADEERM